VTGGSGSAKLRQVRDQTKEFAKERISRVSRVSLVGDVQLSVLPFKSKRRRSTGRAPLREADGAHERHSAAAREDEPDDTEPRLLLTCVNAASTAPVAPPADAPRHT
jgi:hypothetical protein